jgi:hypothetical protein
MAEVLEARLSISREERFDRATVSGRVRFSPGEIRLGLSYEMHIFLVEVDGALDRFVLVTNGFLGNFPSIGYYIGERPTYYTPRVEKIDDEDEGLNYRAGIVLTPPASGVLGYSESLVITPSNRESGNEEYQALVWVVPEICNGFRTTRRISLNLG